MMVEGCVKNLMDLISGVITKGIGGFYYVNTKDGVIECRARGVFRKKGFTPLVGDSVKIELNRENPKTGVVSVVKERKNQLIRPAVANVTQMAVVVAFENPRPNTYILDKLIASAEFIGLKIVICFNKSDLSDEREITEIYRNAGFDVIELSATQNENTDELRRFLKDEITVFAGNSGVGKSSLLNLMLNKEIFETGEVSSRVERGKHTTRHSELVALPFGGYIIDTPGFSSFDINTVPLDALSRMFREFNEYTDGCKFLDCSHTTEPGCLVIEAVESGKISKSRHESYKLLYDEIKSIKKW